MQDNWRAYFEPRILARGEHYYEDGHVVAIKHAENRVSALVQGSELYWVEISLRGDALAHTQCTCPYYAQNGWDCKHIAAVLFALENKFDPGWQPEWQQAWDMQEQRRRKRERSIRQRERQRMQEIQARVLDADPQSVQGFLMEALRQDDELWELFCEMTTHEYTMDVQ